jgi:exopolysaccharide production protein ExoQ
MAVSLDVARRGRSVRGSAPRLAERVLVVAGLFLATGTLTRWTGADDPGATLRGNLINEVVWGAFYVGAIAALFTETRAVRRMMPIAAPLAAITGLALLSVLWSDLPLLSLRRATALLGTTILALYLVVRFPLRDFLRMLAGAFGAVAVLSLLVIVAAPGIGLEQYDYAGAWRGILDNKNGLGQTMTFGVITCIVLAAEEGGWARVRAAGLATLCGILVLGSGSVGSLLVAAACGSLTAVVLGFRASQSHGLTILALLYVLVVALAALVIFSLGLDGAIEALGRSPDLTGRMQLWPLVIDAIGNKPLLGHGYAAFWPAHGGVADHIEDVMGFRPFYAHDGFLDLALDAGLVGVALFLAVLSVGFVRASVAATRIGRPIAVWSLVIMATFLAANVAESSIAQYNQLGWVLFSVAFLHAALPRGIEVPPWRPAGA